jgi:hypothetical protein
MYKKAKIFLAAALVISIVPIANGAEKLIREFKGTTSTITAEFNVDGPWLLDWRVNSDYSRFMAIDIVLLDAETGFQVGRVKHKKEPDNGLRLFEQGGRYKVRIDSSHTRWQVKIIQISEADVERYTSK